MLLALLMTIVTINPVAQAEDAVSSTGSITWQTTVKRGVGRGSMHAGPSGAGTAASIFGSYAANGTVQALGLADGYATFHFRGDTFPASGDEIICRICSGSSTRKMDLNLRSDGKLELYDRAGALVGTGTTVLSTGQWYRIAIRAGNGAAANYAIYIARDGESFGAAELSGTCDQAATAFDRVQLGKAANKSTQTMSMYFQDLVVDDAQIWPHFHMGIALPRAAGSQTGWTGTYQDVDEFPHDNTTTEINSATSGQRESCLMTSGADLGITNMDAINAVSEACIRVGDGVNEAHQLEFISGASTTQTTGVNLTASYAMGQFLKLLDPNTAAAWTRDGYDAIECGVKANSAINTRVTSIMAYVMYTPTPLVEALVAATHPFHPQRPIPVPYH